MEISLVSNLVSNDQYFGSPKSGLLAESTFVRSRVGIEELPPFAGKSSITLT